jgi:hypothetical protein
MMKAILTGLVTFVGLVIVLYFGAITQWTFVPREDVATGVGYLKFIAPFIFVISAIVAISVALLVRRFGRRRKGGGGGSRSAVGLWSLWLV